MESLLQTCQFLIIGCYWKNGYDIVFFDPLAQVASVKIQNYLKTRDQFDNNLSVIQRNIDRLPVDHIGNILLHVLKTLTDGSRYKRPTLTRK